MSDLMTGLLAATTTATTHATKSAGSSSKYLLIIIALFGVVYFLVIRPRQQKQKAALADKKKAEIGDEVMTIGGLVGTIVAEDGDRVTIATGNGQELVFIRQAIRQKLTPKDAPSEPIEDDESHDGTEGGEPTQ